MKQKHKKHNTGSVSHGTMRAQDLIPAFLDELRSQTPTKQEHRRLATRIERASRAKDYWDSGDAETDLESLFDALDEYSLDHMYFGAHPGDGSDYGYWLPEGWDEDFDGLKVGGLGEVPSSYVGEVLQVSDHGNITLYVKYSNGRTKEIWSFV